MTAAHLPQGTRTVRRMTYYSVNNPSPASELMIPCGAPLSGAPMRPSPARTQERAGVGAWLRHASLFVLAMAVVPAIGVCQVTPAPPAPWRTLTMADVERLHQSVLALHPGMRDTETPDFAARVDSAYRTAIAQASSASSYLDWRSAMQRFMLSFRDGHAIFRPVVQPTRFRWPGFLIDGRRDGWVVRRPRGIEVVDTVPAEGARLLSCDGVEIGTLLQTRLDGVEADWSKEPERLRQAFRLFIDYRTDGVPPVRECSFSHGGHSATYTLRWRTDAWSAISAGLSPFLRQGSRRVASHTDHTGGFWITLGTFGDEVRLESLAHALETQGRPMRRAPYIVFDLRGNAGGNSTWGDRFAAVVWGQKFAAAHNAARTMTAGGRAGKYWRASGDAAIAARATSNEFSAMGPAYADVARYWQEVADRMSTAPDGDRALVHDPCCDPDSVTVPLMTVASRYARPVYVLIDAGCFSSCVLAANTLMRNGAISVGESSRQNEEYGEIVTPPPLPSGLASYFLPISIIRQAPTALRVVPTFRWSGAMDDDVGLARWIAQLRPMRCCHRGSATTDR